MGWMEDEDEADDEQEDKSEEITAEGRIVINSFLAEQILDDFADGIIRIAQERAQAKINVITAIGLEVRGVAIVLLTGVLACIVAWKLL